MFRPKIALHWASLVLSISLLLLQGPAFAGSDSHSNDTIYLDRKGKEINRGPHTKIHKTFIVRTTCKTSDIYSIDRFKLNGTSHYILKTEARKTKLLIKKGKYEEAYQTGNLVELRPLEERQEDGKLMQQDNGTGGTDSVNNREYASFIFANGKRKEIIGEITDPNGGDPEIAFKKRTDIITYSHSHPSGTHEIENIVHKFYPQGPSKPDIDSLSNGQVRVVFGRENNKVYLYDSTGVIAVLPTKVYIRL